MSNRRKKRESKNAAIKRHRQLRMRGVLDRLGLWNELSSGIRTFLQDAYYPPIHVSLAKHLPRDPGLLDLERQLINALENATIHSPILGDYPLQDYCQFALPVLRVLRGVKKTLMAPSQSALVEKIAKIMALRSADKGRSLNQAFGWALMPKILEYSRCDEYIYFLKHASFQTDAGRLRHEFTIDRVQPEKRRITKDGQPRDAYRCGITDLGGVEWMEVPASLFGNAGEERSYPVFVQKHTLSRLYGRESRLFRDKEDKVLISICVALSLREPQVLPNTRADGSFLIAYALGKQRLGYFVARIVDDVVLLETFLFLTMDGTPEGDNLRRRWRLKRDDKAYTGIDDLTTFLETDLASDPEIAALLNDCGCGSLIEI